MRAKLSGRRGASRANTSRSQRLPRLAAARAAFGPFCYLWRAMKKSAFSAALLALGFLVPGCPVYDGSDIGCFDDFDCPYGYVCDGASALCVTPSSNGLSCNEPRDCASNETCSRSGTCKAGDCHFASVGCVKGYECSSASGRWECVREGDASAGGAPPSPSSGGEPSASGTGGSGDDAEGGSGGSTSAAGSPSSAGGEPTSTGGEPSASAGAAG